MCLSGATNFLNRTRLLRMQMNITANTYHVNNKNINNNTSSSSYVTTTHAVPTTTTTLPTSILRRAGLTTPSSSTTPAVTVVHRKVHWPHNLDQHKQVVKFDKVDAIAACDIGSPFEGDWYYPAQEDVFYDALDEMALDDMHTVSNVRDAVFLTGTDVEVEQQQHEERTDAEDIMVEDCDVVMADEDVISTDTDVEMILIEESTTTTNYPNAMEVDAEEFMLQDIDIVMVDEGVISHDMDIEMHLIEESTTTNYPDAMEVDAEEVTVQHDVVMADAEVYSADADVEMQQGNMEEMDCMDWAPVVHEVEGVCTMDWKPVVQEVDEVDCMDWEPVGQEFDDVDCMDWEPVGQEGVEVVDGMDWELLPPGENKHFIADSIQSSFISLWSPAVSSIYSHAEVGCR